MTEVCADCGASFASPAELVTHMQKEHRGGDAAKSLEMNPMSHVNDLECALCGRLFPTREALAAHNLEPHAKRPGARRRAAAGPSSTT